MSRTVERGVDESLRRLVAAAERVATLRH